MRRPSPSPGPVVPRTARWPHIRASIACAAARPIGTKTPCGATYTTLTDVEAVFRALKSELGLRPIYHHKPRRADGHLFITVIAYQLVQVIRTRLRAHGEHASWTTLRRILEGQQRVTATFRRPDGRTLHVRTATQAEPAQRAIYDALGIDPKPGGVRKTII